MGYRRTRSRGVAFEPVRAGWEAFDHSIAMASVSVGKSADISEKCNVSLFSLYPGSLMATTHSPHSPSICTQGQGGYGTRREEDETKTLLVQHRVSHTAWT